jgi:hypothetical protein
MEERLMFFAGLVSVAVIVVVSIAGRIKHKRLPAMQSVRRGTGNAMLGLQQFIEPSVEYVFQAQNVEQNEEEDDQGLDGDEDAVCSNLAEALGRTPVDPEEVRRHLAAAARLGLDWRVIFDRAVADELRDRPFRAPSMPPTRRVAPRA